MLHFQAETISTRNCLKWWSWRALLGIPIFWALLIFFIPTVVIIDRHFAAGSWNFYVDYLFELANGRFGAPFSNYWSWLWAFLFHEPKHMTWYSYFAWRIMLVPTFLFLGYEFLLFNLNPYYLKPQYCGDARAMTVSEAREFGLIPGKHLLVGFLNGHKLKLPDTNSVFCIGAPDTGKTTGIIIPAIFEENESSLIIHDPKGELAKLTSGHRAKLGPVFMLNWMARDYPDRGIYWPSWNPIGGKNLPPMGPGRENYVDALVSFLIPDGPSGTDPYWVKTGRGCLSGMTGYLCGKVDQAKANDYFLERVRDNKLDDDDYAVLLSYYEAMRDFPEVIAARENVKKKNITIENYLPIGTWELIPDEWRGFDACFAMLLDIINNAQIETNEQIAKWKEEQDPRAFNADTWGMIFDKIVLETAYYGYGRRALLELNQVLSLPDKQRGSVLSMALSGINIFKNAAVRYRTSLNDFDYSQLRGIKDEKTGKYQPVTIYLSVPLSDLKACVLLSTLFINMATESLMSKGPNEGGMGPYPISFILDEFQHMPSANSITDGVVFGRSKQNKFLICVQDWHQIVAKYDNETADILISSSVAKVVKRANNPDTRFRFLSGQAKYSKTARSLDSKRGYFDISGSLVPSANKNNINTNWYWDLKVKKKQVPDNIAGFSSSLSMVNTKHFVFYVGHYDRPIKAQTPLYYKNEEYKKLASIKPAPYMPASMIHDLDEINRVGKMHVKTITLDEVKSTPKNS